MKIMRLFVPLMALALISGLAVGQETKPKQEDAVQSWVKVLAGKVGHKNQIISRSVERALVTVGKPAVATLQKIAEGKDSAKAKAAKRIIDQINNPRRGNRNNRGRRDPLAGMKLSDEVKAKAQKALEEDGAKRRELFEQMRNGELDRQEMREAMQEMRTALDAKMKSILSEADYKKYKENSSRRRGGRRRRGGDG